MGVILFPRKVEEIIKGKGYVKSKSSGKYYKKYQDSDEEFIAMPKCIEEHGEKAISWFIFATDNRRKMHTQEARQLSKEFDEDGTEIEMSMGKEE